MLPCLPDEPPRKARKMLRHVHMLQGCHPQLRVVSIKPCLSSRLICSQRCSLVVWDVLQQRWNLNQSKCYLWCLIQLKMHCILFNCHMYEIVYQDFISDVCTSNCEKSGYCQNKPTNSKTAEVQLGAASPLQSNHKFQDINGSIGQILQQRITFKSIADITNELWDISIALN